MDICGHNWRHVNSAFHDDEDDEDDQGDEDDQDSEDDEDGEDGEDDEDGEVGGPEEGNKGDRWLSKLASLMAEPPVPQFCPKAVSVEGNFTRG